MYGDTRLYTDPDQVASVDSVAWATAFWFWKVNVHTDANVQRGWFGSSTNRINGALECAGAYQYKAKQRFTKYGIVLKAFNVNESPIENGCYN